MNIDQFENRMILALEDELSSADFDQLMKEIELDESLTATWQSYKALYSGMEAISNEEPNEQVKDRFYDWLEGYSDDEVKVVDIAQKSVKKGPFIVWRKWASAAAVMVGMIGVWTIYNHNQNVQNTLADVSQQMEILMEQQSSTARIKAIRVNYNPNSTSVDDNMIQVLIKVLNEDASSNVRLAAVETLANYIDQDVVREALIKRLKEESDGGVKLSIITSLGQHNDEKFRSTLENIVNDDSQEKFVIDEAYMQLIRIDI